MGKMINAVLCILLLAVPLSAAAEKAGITPVLNRQYLPECVRLIDSAKTSVDMAFLYFNDDASTAKVAEALSRARQRNVAVRVVLEDSIKDNAAAVERLAALGISAKLDGPDKQTHCKLILIDGEKALLGSTNMSARSLDSNNETNAVIEDRSVAAYFEDFFSAAWNGAKARDGKYAGGPSNAIPAGGSTYFREARGLILNSRRKIGLIVYNCRYYGPASSNPANLLLDSLRAAAKRGVDARVILERSDFDEEVNRTNDESAAYLMSNGVKVRFDRRDVITHAKLLLVDGKTALGSENWGMSGFAKNRETNIFLNDGAASDAYWHYFEEQWKNAAEAGK